MFDLRSIDGTCWLAEPSAVRTAVARLRSFATCPTARELATFRRERLDEMKGAASRAMLSVGTDHPAERMASGKQIRAAKGKVGVIGVYGPIQQRMTSEMMKLGGTSTEEIGLALDALLDDRSVGAIVLHVDSPGGSSYGVEELSDKIYEARGRKPIYAHADSLAASAAYWIATAADMVLVTPGGDVGSVGVYAVHVDQSKSMEMEGVRVEIVRAGKYKAEINNVEPLTDAARTYLQESVNETYDKFIGALKRNRNTTLDDVRTNYGQGRVMSANASLKVGMADRVMSFSDFLDRLLGRGGAEGGGRQASMEQERRRQEQRKRQEDFAGAYR